MTTIAYRDGVLAADSLTTRGGTIDGHVRKIDRRDDGLLIAATGSLAYNSMFRAWALAGMAGDPPKSPNEDAGGGTGVLFWPDGRVEFYEAEGRFSLDAPYHAIGCGFQIALGAMFAGADAETAVRAAVAHDTCTGGEVIVLRRFG